MKQTLMSSATSSFAHLLGRPTAAKAVEDTSEPKPDEDTAAASKPAAEDDDDGQREGESDEDYKKRKDKAAAKPAAAADPDDDEEEGDDKSDEADARKKNARAPRMRERARCRAIFADPAAGKNPPLAAALAFDTDLTRTQAIKVLQTGGLAVPANRNTLDARMATIKTPPIAAGDAPGTTRPPGAATNSPYEMATRISASGMRARGKSEESVQAFIAERERDRPAA